jgi:hypothetical protein
MADPRDDEPVRRSPPPDTVRAFHEQATVALVIEARRYASTLVPMVRHAGRATSPLYNLELVNDALTDTLSGDVTWDPAECSLIEHVCTLIKTRAFREVRRAHRFRHLPIEAPSNDPRWEVEVEHAARAASSGDISPFMLAALVERVVPDLRRLAARSADACSILDCWRDGVTEKAAVRTRTGLGDAEYHAARGRLLYHARRLPPELRDAVQNLLRSAS